MKRVIISIILIAFASSVAFGVTAEQKRISQLQKDIKRLELRESATKKEIEKIKTQKRLETLRKELDSLSAAPGKPGPAPVEVPGPYGIPIPEKKKGDQALLKPVLAKEKKKSLTQPPLEFGLSIGVMANIPAGIAELRWMRPLSLERVAIKTGVMYAVGDDLNKMSRKNALIFLDGVIEIEPPRGEGVGTYIGGGLNYNAYTTGRVSGTVGGEVYMGVTSKMSKHQSMYAEIGYGVIRTGFSPSFKGVSAMVGIKNVL